MNADDRDGDFDDESVTIELPALPVPEEPLEAPPELSRKVRSRRRTRPRSKTIAMRRVTMAELQLGALMYPPVDVPRPQTRAECRGEARPCPWVACKHHLYLDINPETGSIKINFPDLEPWELQHTCALDVAEDGARTLEQIGEITNLTRERVRQVEVRGLLKLKAYTRVLR
ncbi:MAG: sigma factor-like helix-turn-helix DNA-binding protein [Kofleriaceae bacterium]